MRIPPYAEGTLSDYLEQRIDALELFILDKFGLELDESAHLQEVMDTRASYRANVDAICGDEDPEEEEYELTDTDGDYIGEFTPEDEEPFLGE